MIREIMPLSFLASRLYFCYNIDTYSTNNKNNNNNNNNNKNNNNNNNNYYYYYYYYYAVENISGFLYNLQRDCSNYRTFNTYFH